jgi:hypothetical protein
VRATFRSPASITARHGSFGRAGWRSTAARRGFWRDADGASHFDVPRRRGALRVVRQPPPESLSAGVFERIGALAETAW